LPVLVLQLPLDSHLATLSQVVVLAADAGLPLPMVRATATVLTPAAPAIAARRFPLDFLCAAI
jgi:hypothetical protein